MAILGKFNRPFDLTKIDREDLISKFKRSLDGRCEQAYFFGSFAKNEVNPDSDIDLLIIVKTDITFVERGRSFADLFDIFPKLDLLVFTPEEFEKKLNSKDASFPKEMKNSFWPVF